MIEHEQKSGYECGHCREEKPGQPFMQVVIEGQHVDMCCVGCACAAQFVDRYQNKLSTQSSTSAYS